MRLALFLFLLPLHLAHAEPAHAEPSCPAGADLSGTWKGEYVYTGDQAHLPPIEFSMSLSMTSGASSGGFTGSATEPNTMVMVAMGVETLTSQITGGRLDADCKVRFTK